VVRAAVVNMPVARGRALPALVSGVASSGFHTAVLLACLKVRPVSDLRKYGISGSLFVGLAYALTRYPSQPPSVKRHVSYEQKP